MEDDDFTIFGHYLYDPLPPIDKESFEKFLKQSELHNSKRKECKYYKRIYSNFEINGEKILSHFGDCHNPDNKTNNCSYNLCPIR